MVDRHRRDLHQAHAEGTSTGLEQGLFLLPVLLGPMNCPFIGEQDARNVGDAMRLTGDRATGEEEGEFKGDAADDDIGDARGELRFCEWSDS